MTGETESFFSDPLGYAGFMQSSEEAAVSVRMSGTDFGFLSEG